MDERNLKFVGVLIHQRQFEIRGDIAAVNLRQQRGLRWIYGRMVLLGHCQRVQDLQAVQGVMADQRQAGLNEAKAVNDFDVKRFRPRPLHVYARDAGLPDQRDRPGRRRQLVRLAWRLSRMRVAISA